jgi:hypothetical protein
MTRLLDEEPDVVALQTAIAELTSTPASLPAAVRAAVDADLATKRKELVATQTGRSMAAWAERMRSNVQLAQFFARSQAGKQNCVPKDNNETWPMRWHGFWEANRNAVVTGTNVLFAREFLLHRPHSMETLGLAEVVYPGLDTCTLPPLDQFRREEQDRLAPAWPDLLACLCDLLRDRGYVTLPLQQKLWVDSGSGSRPSV